ncbi:tRNA dimethylallyltransferase [Monosporozyma servazzii]
MLKTLSKLLIPQNKISTMIQQQKKKIIVIVGTTGVGKSDLSIEIAKRFNGECINADSMQVYKDAPIITNKHPVPERMGIPHHVMNHVPWNEEYFIHRFENECIDTIDDIHNRGKLPIIVGGTHYYLQVLFDKITSSIEKNSTTSPINDEQQFNQLCQRHPVLVGEENKQARYDLLTQLDPEIAQKYHPNDDRRVLRMLEIFYTSNIKPSDIFKQQKLSLKYDTLFLWLYSEPDALNQRLDTRVDKMLDIGGMDEIKQLYKYFNDHHLTSQQCENGIWQVIGYKEFLPWLQDPQHNTLEDGIERMKIRTRQYAKRQVKWIKKMLIPDINGEGIYLLNATDLTQWQQLVCNRAIDISKEFLENNPITYDQAPSELTQLISTEETVARKKDLDWKHYECEICRDSDNKKLVAIGEKDWQIHLKGRRHKSNSSRGSKKAQYEKWKLEQQSKGDL